MLILFSHVLSELLLQLHMEYNVVLFQLLKTETINLCLSCQIINARYIGIRRRCFVLNEICL